MKTYKLFPLFAAAMMFAACNQNEPTNTTTDYSNEEPVELQLRGKMNISAEAGTRAAGLDENGAFDANDKIAVYMAKTGTTTLVKSNGNKDYIIYSTSSTEPSWDNDAPQYQVFTPTTEDKFYFPFDGTNVDIYAYYYNSTNYKSCYNLNGIYNNTTCNIDCSLKDQTTIDKVYSKDLITAIRKSTTSSPINKVNPIVELLFEHKMTMVYFNIKGVDDITETDIVGLIPATRSTTPCFGILSYKSSTSGSKSYYGYTYSIYTNTVTPKSTSYNSSYSSYGGFSEDNEGIKPCPLETPATGYHKSFVAIMMPYSIMKDYRLRIYIKGNAYYWSDWASVVASNEHAFEAGYITTMNITITKHKAEVKAAVTPWKTNETPVEIELF